MKILGIVAQYEAPEPEGTLQYGLTFVNGVLVGISMDWNEDMEIVEKSDYLDIKLGDTLFGVHLKSGEHNYALHQCLSCTIKDITDEKSFNSRMG